MESTQLDPRHRQLRASLSGWGNQVRRDLPWRRTRDPWLILVSETMLQQTQVARVIPKYEAFRREMPSPQACADAPPARVIELWQGLGYNRRALNLHRAATVIAGELDGCFPNTLDGLLELPGVGPYTARAVLAFAYEADHGVVDTNAARFLARAVAGRPLGSREAQCLADAMVPSGDGWAWNQSVLDLGATVCRKRAPACDACPLQADCAWYQDDLAEPDPATGSAGVSTPQSRFEGSDRQGRGRLVDALRLGPVRRSDLPEAMGWADDRERAERVADGLLRDGLAEEVGGYMVLPS